MATKEKSKFTSGSPFRFEITRDWKPAKHTNNKEFTEAVVTTAVQLMSRESFPISMVDFKRFGGYINANSAASCIRAAILKRVGKDKIGSYGVHIVKDNSGKEIGIRVRRK